jgi:hypothetical protein
VCLCHAYVCVTRVSVVIYCLPFITSMLLGRFKFAPTRPAPFLLPPDFFVGHTCYFSAFVSHGHYPVFAPPLLSYERHSQICEYLGLGCAGISGEKKNTRNSQAPRSGVWGIERLDRLPVPLYSALFLVLPFLVENTRQIRSGEAAGAIRGEQVYVVTNKSSCKGMKSRAHGCKRGVIQTQLK